MGSSSTDPCSLRIAKNISAFPGRPRSDYSVPDRRFDFIGKYRSSKELNNALFSSFNPRFLGTTERFT
jgi:hypothetical protein